MEVAKISSKGQITIPVSVRNKLKLRAGDKIVILEENGRFYFENSAMLAFKRAEDAFAGEAQKAGFETEEDMQEYMIPVDADFSKYKIVVAPVLYMVKDGMKEALENFVKNGGILITTFMSGIVGQSDNVYLGGYPGPLREMAGVWVEEIDALAPEQKNKAKFADGSTAACGLLCDLMHLEGAKALASYEEDFYAGMPAASKNTYGKGTTYYIATRFEEEGLAKILDQAVQEAGVSSVIPEETGLEVVTRVSDTTRFYFVMNFTDEEQILPKSLTGKKDMISQKMTEHGMKLKKWDVLLLEEHL